MFDFKKFHEFTVQFIIKLCALVRCNYLWQPNFHEKIKHQYNIDIHMQSTLKSTIATVDADLSTVGTTSTHFEK